MGKSDDSMVWRAINWEGDLNNTSQNYPYCPIDDEFWRHFESPKSTALPPGADTHDVDTNTKIPVLDSIIIIEDVQHQKEN